MIAWCLEEKKAYPVLIRDGRTFFRCISHDLFFLQNQNEVLLRIPYGIAYESKSRITHESTLSIKEECGQRCVICFSGYEKGYGKFRRYTPEKLITIGSSVEDDLYLQDHHLKAGHIAIHYDEGTIEDRGGYPMVMLNDHYLKKEAFHDGDVLRTMNLQIILHHDFITVNCPDNLYHSLKPFQHEMACRPLEITQLVPVARRYRHPVLTTDIPVDLEEPRPLEKAKRQPLVFMMGPALTMSGATLAAGFLTAYNGYLNGRSLEEMLPMILLPCMMLVSTMLWNPLQRRYDKRMDRRDRKQRILDYTIYLNSLQQKITDLEKEYICTVSQEIPFLLPVSFELKNAYQKLPLHDDWLHVNLGHGRVDFHYQISRAFRLSESDPLQKMTIDALQNTSSMAGDLVLPMAEYRMLAVSGKERERFAEYLLAQLLISHGPDVLRVIFLCEEEWLEQHAWVRCIPHTEAADGTRLIVHLQSEISEMLASLELDSCKAAVVFSTKPSMLKEIKDQRIHAVVLCAAAVPPEADARICIEEDNCEIEDRLSSRKALCRIPESFSMEQLLDQLNHCYLQRENGAIASADFLSLHDCENAASLNILKQWNTSLCRNGIKCILGISENEEKVYLDLHEKGQGPHGLIAGTTGSGKSELIISLIFSLVIHYSPRELQFVLIDFKGGGAAQVFSNEAYTLPHIAGVLSNLDVSEMERALVSFANECRRREVLFKKMSICTHQPVMNLADFQSLWLEEYGLPYIAELVIIVDEFAELKKEKPDFMRDLISIARVGRSLGIHLILSTQKPSGVVDDQIWSNSRFKICLKVQNRQDSIEMLHDPCASFIRKPGEFYLLYDGMMQHARSGYTGAVEGKEPASLEMLDWMNHVISASAERRENQHNQSQAVIQEIKAADQIFGIRADSLWLPPVTKAVLPVNTGPGIYLGIADDYYNRTQKWVRYDPAVYQHMCIFSIQREEKTAFLSTLLKGMIDPEDRKREIFLIDDLSFRESLINACPQLCSLFSSDDAEKIRNLNLHIQKRTFDQKGECFVIIDDLASFYASGEDNKALLHRMLETGARHKTHFILFMNAASVIPYRDLTLIPFRLSLANANEQDLGQIFEKPVHRKVGRGHGMLLDGNLLDVKLLETGNQELMDAVSYCIRILGSKKVYHLPEIKEKVSLKEYEGDGYGLGIDIQNYQWVEVKKDQILLVLATYEEELYDMQNFWKKHARNVLISPDDQTIKKLIEERAGGLAFMTLDAYRYSLFKSCARRIPILYIGTGFRDQYEFSIASWRGDMKKNYGVYFQAARKQVIQIAETAE